MQDAHPQRDSEEAQLLRKYEACLSSPDKSTRQAALSILIEHFRPNVLAALLKSGASREDAEDAIQGSYCSMCSYYRNRNGAPFKAYLIRTAINRWRRNEGREALFPRAADDLIDVPDRKAQNAEERLIERQSKESLASALLSLSAEDRALVLARQIEGKTFREIGLELRMPPTTAHYRFERAWRRLIEQMNAVEIKGAHK